MSRTRDLNRTQMLEERIDKLLFIFSAPTTLAMLTVTVYQVTNTIFIGHYVGTKALAALTVSLPVMMLVFSLALAVGVGGSSVWSVDMGAKDFHKAHKIFSNSLFLNIISGFILIIIALFFIDNLLHFVGANKEIFPYAKTFLRIFLLGSVITLFSESSLFFIRAEGKLIQAMAFTMIAALSNIVFDYLLIAKLKLGVTGAATGIILSDSMLLSLVVWHFMSGKSKLNLSKYIFRPEWPLIKEIIKIGIASFIRQITIGIKQFMVNKSVIWYSHTLASTYLAIIGISHRLLLIVMIPIFGVFIGMQPIIGFNYGAKSYLRVKKIIILGILYCIGISSVIWLFLILCPEMILKWFSKDPAVLENGKNIARIVIFSTPFVAGQAAGAAIFQPLKKPIPAIFFALLRQFILLIPLILVLPLILGLNGVFFAIPTADFIAFAITMFWVSRELKLLEKLDKEQVVKES